MIRNSFRGFKSHFYQLITQGCGAAVARSVWSRLVGGSNPSILITEDYILKLCARNLRYTILEVTKEEIKKLLKGVELLKESDEHDNLVRIYCDDPDETTDLVEDIND